MLLTSDAIVLSTQKIKDTSLLVHLYTREAGRMNLLVFGAQSKKKGNCHSLLYPLSLVSIEADIRNSRELNTLKEVRPLEPTHDLLFNPIKSTLAFFCAEVLTHCLLTNEQDPLLFDFIRYSISQLNRQNAGLGNFHICFLIRLSRFLGFQPSLSADNPTAFFDLTSAEYTSMQPSHHHFLNESETSVLRQLLRMNYRNMHLFKFTRAERATILEKTLDYYHIHQHGFGEIKSIHVLREMMD